MGSFYTWKVFLDIVTYATHHTVCSKRNEAFQHGSLLQDAGSVWYYHLTEFLFLLNVDSLVVGSCEYNYETYGYNKGEKYLD
jgi:hypothetical protein